MIRIPTLLLLILIPSVSLVAETPLRQFVAARGYKARSNPGSFSLVGDIYPDKDRVGQGRIFKLSECFPDLNPDPPEALDNTTEVVNYGTSDLSLLLNLARRDPKNSPDDLANLETGFTANRVRFVTLKATDLVHIGISTGVIREKAQGQCREALFVQRNYLIADAIGATTLSYQFLDDSKRDITAKLSALAALLFRVGLSKSQTAVGSATFTNPVFIGFSIVRWDGSKFQLQ